MTRRLVAAAVVLVVAAGAQPASGGDPAARASMDGMQMVGNMQQYPDLERAGPRNVGRARRLLHASRRTAHRFDSMSKARRLGYTVRRWHRPGFTHARKHETRFWGKLFDADAPQALVFWCSSHGHCTLAAYMYRAPAGKPPSTWHKLLQWHRHDDTPDATWMTHVWLVKSVRKAFATCAPMGALATSLGIHEEPNDHAIRPCEADQPADGQDEPMR